jgi:hypothetical protein
MKTSYDSTSEGKIVNPKIIASLAIVAIVLSSIAITIGSINLIYLVNPNLSPFSQQPTITDAEIFCQVQQVYVQGASHFYGQQYGSYPMLAYGVSGHGFFNFTNLPDVNLQIYITNNNTKSLFNVAVVVSYRNLQNTWVNTTKAEVGFLDIQQNKEAHSTLMSPKVFYIQWWTNVINNTIPVLNMTDLRVTAYGFSKP